MRSCMPVPALLPIGSASRQRIGEFVIARPLARFLRARPDINIQMSMGNTEELLGGLRDAPATLLSSRDTFRKRNLPAGVQHGRLIPVCSASHTFSRPPERMSDLLCETLILREPGSGTRDILERALKLHNIPLSSFSRVTELNSMYAIVQLLLEDCGISFCIKPPSCLIFAKEGCSRSHCGTSACSTTFLFSGKKVACFPQNTKKYLPI